MGMFERPFIEVGSTSGNVEGNSVVVLNIVLEKDTDVNKIIELITKLANERRIYVHGMNNWKTSDDVRFES